MENAIINVSWVNIEWRIDLRAFGHGFGVILFKLLKLKAKASVIQTFYEMDYHLAFTLFDLA